MNKIDIVKKPVYIDGILYGYDLDLLVDGEVPSNDVFDPIEFIASTYKIQRAYFFTCSCGNSGCAGIHEGIHVKQRTRTIEWRDLDTPINMKKRYYSFDKNEYKSAQALCMGLMYEIIHENEAIRKEVLIDGDPLERFGWHAPTFCEIYSESELLSALKYRQEWIENYHLL
ncbi:hypothetical protein [Stenotrophomonas phage RAS14]